jgi:rod shape-determining protein MreD
MTDEATYLYSDLEERRLARIRIGVVVTTALAAILFQVYVPRFLQVLSYLALPLLVTVYFALMRRSPIVGLFIGAGIGLAQDSLSSYPLGILGIVKTLVGYFAGSVGTRLSVEHPVIRFVLCFFFVVFHDFLYWVLVRALLAMPLPLDFPQLLFVALLNAVVGVTLFHLLDKLRIKA